MVISDFAWATPFVAAREKGETMTRYTATPDIKPGRTMFVVSLLMFALAEATPG
jgi:hypothetical protein